MTQSWWGTSLPQQSWGERLGSRWLRPQWKSSPAVSGGAVCGRGGTRFIKNAWEKQMWFSFVSITGGRSVWCQAGWFVQVAMSLACC